MQAAIGMLGMILRYLWPFMKEWFFDKRTVVNWLKKHWVLLSFTILVTVLGYSNFKITMYVINLKQHVMDTQERNDTLQTLYRDQTKRAGLLIVEVKRLEKELELKNTALEGLEDKVKLYEHWMESCGMNHNAPAETMPKCTTTQVRGTTNTRRPSNKQNNQNSDIAERVRRIWGQGK